MTVNLSKTKEIVFHRPSARYSLPSLITGIEQVVSAKLLELLSLITLNLMNMLKTSSQSVINVVISLSV